MLRQCIRHDLRGSPWETIVSCDTCHVEIAQLSNVTAGFGYRTLSGQVLEQGGWDIKPREHTCPECKEKSNARS